MLAQDDPDLPHARPWARPWALPSTLWHSDPQYACWVWVQVDVDDSRLEGKAEKINITMPRRFLTRVDEYAKQRGMSCSGFLIEAARNTMQG